MARRKVENIGYDPFVSHKNMQVSYRRIQIASWVLSYYIKNKKRPNANKVADHFGIAYQTAVKVCKEASAILPPELAYE